MKIQLMQILILLLFLLHHSKKNFKKIKLSASLLLFTMTNMRNSPAYHTSKLRAGSYSDIYKIKKNVSKFIDLIASNKYRDKTKPPITFFFCLTCFELLCLKGKKSHFFQLL